MPHTPSLRAQRSNPDCHRGKILDCFAVLAMTVWRQLRPTLGVIARLDRAIQYSETAVIESRSCGVLESPPSRGMTVVLGGRSRCLILRHCERSEAIQTTTAERFWIASAFAKASADKSLRSQ